MENTSPFLHSSFPVAKPSLFAEGRISAQGILHLQKPEFGAEFWETSFGTSSTHLPKLTFQNSTQKSGKIFTLHLRKTMWLMILQTLVPLP